MMPAGAVARSHVRLHAHLKVSFSVEHSLEGCLPSWVAPGHCRRFVQLREITQITNPVAGNRTSSGMPHTHALPIICRHRPSIPESMFLSIYEAVYLATEGLDGRKLRVNNLSASQFWHQVRSAFSVLPDPADDRVGFIKDWLCHLTASWLRFLFGLTASCARTPATTCPSLRLPGTGATPSPALVADDLLRERYVAWNHFRTLGWIVKSGLRFGCDFGKSAR